MKQKGITNMGYITVTVTNLIADIKTVLKNESYFPALALTFALISRCANAEYPNNNNDRHKFKTWFDKYITDTLTYGDENCQYGEINGELIYQLRCSLFHEASINIDFKNDNKITHEVNKNLTNQTFTLVLNNYTPAGMWSIGIVSNYPSIEINVCDFINYCLRFIEVYYNNNKEKFKNFTVYDNRHKEQE